jgi:formate hydrogenlyase subunit 3/multisubunit Na+/H+ antiporter MnhD subunit
MTGAGALLGVAFIVPLAMLAACLSAQWRARMPALLAVAPVPALLAALLASGGTLALPQALLRLRLSLDVPGAVLLGTASLLWIVCGLYAAAWLRGRPDSLRFVAWWLLTLAGSIGVFVAADLMSFYLVFSMVSLAAYGLVIDDGTARSRRAGLIYVGLAVLGEAFLLMAFVLLAQAAPGGSLLIPDVVAALPTAPARDAILVLLLLGFGAKIGLVPFHVWMPLAYRAAPIPAAAVLSGAAVKAGVIGLIRFLPPDLALPGWGAALAAIGLFSAYWGVGVGITQSNPKTVLAYSSISQMGLLGAVFGMGLAEGEGGVALAAAFYAAHHILVKGTLFLSVGVVQTAGRRRLWLFLLPTAILALSLAGLPFTGGALAKFAVKAPLGSGVVGAIATLSAAGSALLMLHFVRRLGATAIRPGTQAPPARLVMPWLAALAASLAVPWGLYAWLGIGTLTYAVSPAALWAASWPVALGALLAVGLARWDTRLPRIPPGDVIAFAEDAGQFAGAVGGAMERTDAVLRRWPVAGISLLALALVLGLAMFAGH